MERRKSMERIEELKERIFFSATKLFLKHGYRNTSIRMIGQESGISHTQVIYHFTGKTNLGKQVIQNYFHVLIQLLSTHASIINGDSYQNNKLLWWSYHYLILTSYDGFARFYLQFITDDSEAFFDTVKPIVTKVYHDMFGLNVDLSNKSQMADLQLISGVDMVLTRLCINKTLKVREAIHKLLNLKFFEGFCLDTTEDKIETFILDNQVLDAISDFDISALNQI
ncbi:MAG: TetR/AcrR family transcriptional regulator [Eubacteriales bacterium]